jgi:hypothetical protein
MPFDNPNQTPPRDVELLLAARSLISKKGITGQDRFQDGDRYCLVASLSVVSGSRSFDHSNRVERRLVRLLVKQLPPQFSGWPTLQFPTSRRRLFWFNDHRGTKHDDVMALFDRTIDHLTNKVPVSFRLRL